MSLTKLPKITNADIANMGPGLFHCPLPYAYYLMPEIKSIKEGKSTRMNWVKI